VRQAANHGVMLAMLADRQDQGLRAEVHGKGG
jgi:hypothetical protein